MISIIIKIWIIVLIAIIFIEFTKFSIITGNTGWLVKYLEKKTKEEIINSSFNISLIAIVLFDATPFDYKDDIEIDKEELVRIRNKKYTEEDFLNNKVLEELRKCFITSGESKDLEEKIQIQIWVKLLFSVCNIETNKRNEIFKDMDIKLLKNYLRNHKKIARGLSFYDLL